MIEHDRIAVDINSIGSDDGVPGGTYQKVCGIVERIVSSPIFDNFIILVVMFCSVLSAVADYTSVDQNGTLLPITPVNKLIQVYLSHSYTHTHTKTLDLLDGRYI